MPGKTKRKPAPKISQRLTAIQRAALELARRSDGASLGDYSDRTIESLQERRLIDEVRRTGRYVLTDRGRSVLAYRERHTGTAKR